MANFANQLTFTMNRLSQLFVSRLKNDTVLLISFSCALITSFIIPPDSLWIDYIDFKVIAILFCLMAVVAALRLSGLFDIAAAALTRRCKSIRSLAAILVGITFILSMGITNDVALIVLIPFSLLLLNNITRPKIRIRITVFQTIAANVGSSLTPIGNPQNLFLFTSYDFSVLRFFSITIPVVLLGGLFLGISIWTIPNDDLAKFIPSPNHSISIRKTVLHLVLFILSIGSVFNIIDFRVITVIILAVYLVIDRKLLKKIDYSLLLTFLFFFIFIGNLQRIETISKLLIQIADRNTLLFSALLSQIISNVPAAILISGFTDNAAELLIGVSIGGMGTLIASLASVISFKFFIQNRPGETVKYLGVFTFWNFLLLMIYVIVFNGYTP